jgi:hypothetical protein
MGVDILMDSGAFSAMTKGEVIELDEYIEYIKKCGDNISAHISLDVIGDGDKTYDNWQYMRSKGLDPIPTYHLGTDPKYLQRYLKETDYIGLGGVAGVTTSRTVRETFNALWNNYLTDKKGLPLCKIHGMGITDVRIVAGYPWYSIDSSTWLMTSRRGIIIVPQLSSGKAPDYSVAKRVEVSTKSPHRKRRGQHIENLGSLQKALLLNFIHSKGFILGSSKQNEFGETLSKENGKEDIIERGLSNDYIPRDYINVDFFLELEKSLLNWPWSWPNGKVTYQLQIFDEYAIEKKSTSKNKFTKDRTRIYLAGEGVKEVDTYHVVNDKGMDYRRMLSYPFRRAKVVKDFQPIFDEEKNV